MICVCSSGVKKAESQIPPPVGDYTDVPDELIKARQRAAFKRDDWLKRNTFESMISEKKRGKRR